MKKEIVTFFLFFITTTVYSQIKNEKFRTIGISIPMILNSSEAKFFRLGSLIYTSGKALSYGININHSRALSKNFYVIVGVGYFKQRFYLTRPFNYFSPIQFGWPTKSYEYDNVHLYAGLGYKVPVSKKIFFTGNITYNSYHSFRQKYYNKSPVDAQINHKYMTIGRTLNLDAGVCKSITQLISIRLGVILPVYTHWNDDEIFKQDYAGANKIGSNKFTVGANIAINYHF